MVDAGRMFDVSGVEKYEGKKKRRENGEEIQITCLSVICHCLTKRSIDLDQVHLRVLQIITTAEHTNV